MDKVEKQNDNKKEPVDFETAIRETGFGKFNFLLLTIAGPACLASTYETSTMSYILPSAECDLQLTLLDKGILNGITYAGMITSPILWGFAADIFGRKKLLVFGFLLDCLCVLCGSISQTKYALMIFRYLGGCLMCGPFAVLMAYLTEFHGTKHRARIMILTGLFSNSGSLILPLIAWALLPRDWMINVFDILTIHSWQVFIATCALPSLFAGVLIIFLPESPKFLMSQGKNDEALEVFKKIYAMNEGRPKDEYPIKSLINETYDGKIPVTDKQESDSETKKSAALQNGWTQIKPMFHKPHVGHSILVYVIQFCLLMGLNTYRLWLPQLFTSASDYENNYASAENFTGSSSLCKILEYSVNKSELNVAEVTLENFACETKVSDGMYVNTIIVGVSGLVSYLIAGAIINAVGNKLIMIIGIAIAGSCAMMMFWAESSLSILILSTCVVTIGSICSTAIIGIIVSLFPTTLRTMVVSLSMMFGRSGALIGNLLFPYFMSMGCLPPFLLISSVLMISCVLSIFLPKTHKIPLK